MAGERILTPAPTALAPATNLIIPTVTLFDGSENLRVVSASSIACTLTVFARMRRSDGSVDPMTFTHTPNSDRSIKTQDYAIGAGVLLNLLIVPTSGAPKVGECFVQALIIRGLGGATIPQGVLAQDYTTAQQPVAWPGMPLRRSTEGQGAAKTVVSSNQQGVNISVTVPVGARWGVRGALVVLQTDNLVINRRVNLGMTDAVSGQHLYSWWSTVIQTASLTWEYHARSAVGQVDNSANSQQWIPTVAGIVLRAGDGVSATVIGLDALDTLVLVVFAEEWLEFS